MSIATKSIRISIRARNSSGRLVVGFALLLANAHRCKFLTLSLRVMFGLALAVEPGTCVSGARRVELQLRAPCKMELLFWT